jgi:hypothetical protein
MAAAVAVAIVAAEGVATAVAATAVTAVIMAVAAAAAEAAAVGGGVAAVAAAAAEALGAYAAAVGSCAFGKKPQSPIAALFGKGAVCCSQILASVNPRCPSIPSK